MALADEALRETMALAHTRSWAVVGLLFGTLQTVGATARFVILVRTGVDKLSVTGGILLLSRLGFSATNSNGPSAHPHFR